MVDFYESIGDLWAYKLNETISNEKEKYIKIKAEPYNKKDKIMHEDNS